MRERYYIRRTDTGKVFSWWRMRRGRRPSPIWVRQMAASGWSRNRIGGSGPLEVCTRGELDPHIRRLRQMGYAVLVDGGRRY